MKRIVKRLAAVGLAAALVLPSTIIANANGFSVSRDLVLGSDGDDVYQMQLILQSMGYNVGIPDGYFGNMTYQAVVDFQNDYELYVDGVVGYCTALVLNEHSGGVTVEPAPETAAPETAAPETTAPETTAPETASPETTAPASESITELKLTRELSRGSNGSDVTVLQTLLQKLGYDVGIIDGDFGGMTYNAVTSFQRDYGIYVDGLVGNQTAAKLNEAVTGTAQKPASMGLDTSKWIYYGDTGTHVLAVQKILKEKGYMVSEPDGYYGNESFAAIAILQARCSSEETDGIVGVSTYSFLTYAPEFSPVTKNSSYNEIIGLQRQLYSYGLLGGVDGDFGVVTEAALMTFQERAGLPKTGVGDIATLLKLYECERTVHFEVSGIQYSSSASNWLVVIDTSRNTLWVYYGYSGNWQLVKEWRCSTGAGGEYATVKGVYTINGNRGYCFSGDYQEYTCYWFSSFYGPYLIHSVLYNYMSSEIGDGRLGQNLSHGCVRLSYENALWIYNNIPIGTTVIVY